MNKGFFITMVVAIISGAFLGNFLFERYKEEDKAVLKETNSLYFFIEGVYNNKSQAEKSSENVKVKLITKEDANYVTYLAITKDEANLEKLEKLFKKLKVNATIKKMSINNKEFLTILEQMDLLLKKTNQNEELLAVNEVVLSNYQDLVLE